MRSSKLKCPVCFSSEGETIKLNHALFRHLDFATIKQSGKIGRCGACQMLFNIVTEQDIKELDNLYAGIAYARSGQTGQTLSLHGQQEPVTRSYLQAGMLRQLLYTESPSILDIGCFDGALLAELDLHFKDASLHGFDVNIHLQFESSQKENFRFWTSDLAAVAACFDVICMSHSIMYLRDIPDLMHQIHRLLKPEGFVFLQMPDISKRPYSILLDDQYYYFSPIILRNMFSLFGFDLTLLDNEWCPREIIAIARPTTSIPDSMIMDFQTIQCAQYLDTTAEKLMRLPSASRIGVLGTTVNAAFVDSVLGATIDFFADENPHRTEGKFRGKDVCHPRLLRDSDLLIIPFGESNQSIQCKFAREYKGEFVSV